MKKYIILLIAWALISPAMFASGNDKGEKMIVKIEKGDLAGTVVLRLANLEKKSTQIAVQCTDGTIWFSKNIRRKSAFATKMDLRRLPVGDYVFFVRNGSSMHTQAFAVNNDGIAFFNKPSENRDGSALITQFTDMSDLSLGVKLANLQNRPATIQITMMGYDQVYDKTIRGENGFVKSFNMTGMSDGNYFVCVKSVDATVMQFFTIEESHLTLGDNQRLNRPKDIVVPEEIVIEQ